MGDIAKSIKNLINLIDDDSGREGLANTPARVEKFYKEFYSKPDFNVTTFKNEGYDEMITQLNIPFYSMCEHHMLPFFGEAHIAYIPDQRIVGLSKLSRVLDNFAHGLQNQERITTQVAEYLYGKLDPHGVAVALKARHMCMEMRGIRKIGAQTTTTTLKGAFKHDRATRTEFLQVISS
jgi:GTP cyclohydrolase I